MEPTNIEKVRALPWAVAGFVGNAVFVQYTYLGSAFVLFLNELGFASSQIGFLLSLLSFLGTLAIFSAPLIGRLGYKLASLRFLTARNLLTVLLLAAPWLLARFGREFVFVFMAALLVVIALLRTVAETALISWQQEFVPRAIQGKLFATSNTFISLASIVAFVVGSQIIERAAGLNGFLYLFATGVACGLVAGWSFSHIPGGARQAVSASSASLQGVLATLRDRDFRLWLAGFTLMILATVPLAAFLPLFLREKVGLTAAQVVLLQTGHMIPGLLASYLWGWTADRYGAKPIMLWGVYVIAVLPVLWFIMPQQTSLGFAAAMAVTLLQGLAHSAWAVGLTRLFFVSVVPYDRKEGYMAAHYANFSLSSGISALAGGWVLQAAQGVQGRFLGFPVDAYSILFLISLLLPLLAAWCFSPLRADSSLTTGQVAGLFLRGNAVSALASLISYHTAKDERATIATTERLGAAHSPLTVNELLAVLRDPRFNVRFEAIVSIARSVPDDRLLEALVRILHGSDPALSVAAAWALGRIGDPRAAVPLRQGLASGYRSVQGHCARALGALGDRDSATLLLKRLENEADPGVQIAYATALGRLGEQAALPHLLQLLWEAQEEMAQRELALAVARLLNDERSFVQLCRQLDQEPGAAISGALMDLARRVVKTAHDSQPLLAQLNETAAAFAREDLTGGGALLIACIRRVPEYQVDALSHSVLRECAGRIETAGASRLEYVLLSLSALGRCQPFTPAGQQRRTSRLGKTVSG